MYKIKKEIEKLKKTGNFKKWNIDAEFNPETYIQRGYIDIADDVKFKTIKDACNCFGYNYKGFQKGVTIHPNEENTIIWFPRLNPIPEKPPELGDWDNRISIDEKTITTSHLKSSIINENIIKNVEKIKQTGVRPRRIVFVKVKGNLGMTLYRFRGLYELSIEESLAKEIETWVRIKTRVKTYPSQ